MSYLRVSGEVRSIDKREGISKAGSPYSITTARLLVADRDFVDVTLRDKDPLPVEGDYADLLVRASSSNGFLRIQAQGEWPED